MKLFTSNKQLRSFYRLLKKLNSCSAISTESKSMTQYAVAFVQAQVYHRVVDIKQTAMSDYSTTVNELNSYKYPFSKFFVARAKLFNLRGTLAPDIKAMNSFSANVDYIDLFTLATAYVYAKSLEGIKCGTQNIPQLVAFASEFLNSEELQNQLLAAQDHEGLLNSDKETIHELYTAAMTIKERLQNAHITLTPPSHESGSNNSSNMQNRA